MKNGNLDSSRPHFVFFWAIFVEKWLVEVHHVVTSLQLDNILFILVVKSTLEPVVGLTLLYNLKALCIASKYSSNLLRVCSESTSSTVKTLGENLNPALVIVLLQVFMEVVGFVTLQTCRETNTRHHCNKTVCKRELPFNLN